MAISELIVLMEGTAPITLQYVVVSDSVTVAEDISYFPDLVHVSEFVQIVVVDGNTKTFNVNDTVTITENFAANIIQDLTVNTAGPEYQGVKIYDF